MLEAVGVERLLTMDLHADQIQGFFNIPVDNIYASPVLLSDLQSKRYDNLVVVSPDVGGVVRARALAKQLGCDLAIIDKRRPKANVSEVMHVIGDIEGRNCVIMDDMIDTAGTLVKAAEVLKERGAKSVYAYCTHAVFSGPAIERIKASALDEVVITNTIPLSEDGRKHARRCASCRWPSCSRRPSAASPTASRSPRCSRSRTRTSDRYESGVAQGNPFSVAGPRGPIL